MTINGVKMDKDKIMSLDFNKKDKDALISLLPYDVDLKEVFEFFLKHHKQTTL
tara:strand:+ start:373 stop:531 length:159 start_codon:yes stop_codon:yes gene_type:complete